MSRINTQARYIQIADALLEQIESGIFSSGDQLPPERQLSDTFGVTRMTIRQALRVLEGQGLLVRRQGSGTFVADRKIERHVAHLEPFTRDMAQRGYSPGAKIILFEWRAAALQEAEKLTVSVGSALHYIHRLRLVNSEPVMLEKTLIPERYCPNLKTFDLSQRSLYEVLHKEYEISIAHAYQTLEAVPASDYEAALLQIKVGSPILLEQRVAYDASGRAVEFAKDLHRGDRFRFVIERSESGD